MECEVEGTDEFKAWYDSLDDRETEGIDAVVELLERNGIALGSPWSTQIKGSRHPLRELRKQIGGDPYRILYCFDPRRLAILLLGGCKGGDDRWYEESVPKAEALYDEHLRILQKEGLI